MSSAPPSQSSLSHIVLEMAVPIIKKVVISFKPIYLKDPWHFATLLVMMMSMIMNCCIRLPSGADPTKQWLSWRCVSSSFMWKCWTSDLKILLVFFFFFQTVFLNCCSGGKQGKQHRCCTQPNLWDRLPQVGEVGPDRRKMSAQGPKEVQGDGLHLGGEADPWHPRPSSCSHKDSWRAGSTLTLLEFLALFLFNPGWKLHAELATIHGSSQPVHVSGEHLRWCELYYRKPPGGLAGQEREAVLQAVVGEHDGADADRVHPDRRACLSEVWTRL